MCSSRACFAFPPPSPFPQESQQCDVVPPGQDDLVSAVAATGTPTVVAATCAGACLTPWKDEVAGILLSVGMPGQGYGPALAELVTGTRRPVGRLPVTLPNVDNEVGTLTLTLTLIVTLILTLTLTVT